MMGSQTSATRYVLCVDDGGYPESLDVRKIYQVLPDEQASQREHLRVIDETGEDYLYPAKLFVSIDVPLEATRAWKQLQPTDDPHPR